MSDFLLEQLRAGIVTNHVHPEKVVDEIARLERGQASSTKSATQFKRAPLHPLWHKHFFQPNFIGKNVWNEICKRGDLLDHAYKASADLESDLWKRAGAMANAVLEEGFDAKARSGRLTGEWIVFAKHENANYYLLIAGHNDDPALVRKEVLNCVDQFPFLRALL